MGSIIRFNDNTEETVKEKMIFLVNEIEGYPKHCDIVFEKVQLNGLIVEVAIYVRRQVC